MGEEAAAAVTAPRSSAASAASSSSSLRFLGLSKQPYSPDPNPNPNLELDESDVVWSSSSSSAAAAAAATAAAAADEDPYSFDSSTSPPPVAAIADAAAHSPSDHPRRRHFVPERFGLSALLADDEPQLRRPGAAWQMPVPSPAPEEKVRNGFRQSAPVAVPLWPKTRERRSAMDAVGFWGEEADEEGRGAEEEEEEEDGEMVPPHVIVARSHVMRFSVLEGAGRTLKGRDLRCVRNAVLRKTGFLDLFRGWG